MSTVTELTELLTQNVFIASALVVVVGVIGLASFTDALGKLQGFITKVASEWADRHHKTDHRLSAKPESVGLSERVPPTLLPPSAPTELIIDVVPTATNGGQQPKLLVRITDPNGDYRTQWSVTLQSPSGASYSAAATWPGSGKIFRVRFPTNEPRTGKWSGVAVRNGTESHPFDATLPYPDAA